MSEKTLSEGVAGREMDARVATEVVGWKSKSTDGTWFEAPSGAFRSIGEVPRYSTDIASAWDVVEKLSPQWQIVLDNCNTPGPSWWCFMAHGSHEVEAEADTAPLAICKAALLATEGAAGPAKEDT